MCGLFGAIRCSDPQHARMVSDIVLALGKESEERGTDSSGLAMIVAGKDRRTASKITKENVETTVAGLDRTFIVKNEGRFSNLDFKPYHEVILSPTVFLGHTRWATQGGTKSLANASPLYAGNLIATHNGDIEPSSVPEWKQRQKEAFGETDSEVLFRALDAARSDRRRLVQVLRSIQGRAALAFYDRTRPNRIYLARTGIAPLSYTYDQYGNFYYASNPDWFRRIARKNPDVTFGDITLIPEGHMLTVNTLTGSVDDVRRFTPTVRESDVRILTMVAYRGFTTEDKETDLTLHRHTVVVSPLPKWPSPTVVPVKPAEKPAPTYSSGDTVVTAYKSIDDYWASLGDRSSSSKFDERAAATNPEAWDDEDVEWFARETSMREQASVADDADDYLDKYDPALDAAYDEIDWDAVEVLCERDGVFDVKMFEKIVKASDREALRLIQDLKKDRALDAELDQEMRDAIVRD